MNLEKLFMGVVVSLIVLTVGYAITHPNPANVQPVPVRPMPDDAQPKPAPKRTLVVITGPTCPPCLRMLATTFQDSKVLERMAAMNVIKTGGRDAAKRYGVTSIPAYILFETDTNSNELRRGVGYRAAGEFIDWLDGADKRRQVGEFSNVEE